jgi:hypothetical protein
VIDMMRFKYNRRERNWPLRHPQSSARRAACYMDQVGKRRLALGRAVTSTRTNSASTGYVSLAGPRWPPATPKRSGRALFAAVELLS